MPKIIYCSRPTTWYLQNTRVTCPRVQKRVQKIVNFLVQKLQKPHMFDLGTHRPFMYDALWSICSIGGLWAPLQNCFMVLDPCEKLNNNDTCHLQTDRIAELLKKIFPMDLAVWLNRWKQVLYGAFFYQLCTRYPNWARKFVRKMMWKNCESFMSQ